MGSLGTCAANDLQFGGLCRSIRSPNPENYLHWGQRATVLVEVCACQDGLSGPLFAHWNPTKGINTVPKGLIARADRDSLCGVVVRE